MHFLLIPVKSQTDSDEGDSGGGGGGGDGGCCNCDFLCLRVETF